MNKITYLNHRIRIIRLEKEKKNDTAAIPISTIFSKTEKSTHMVV